MMLCSLLLGILGAVPRVGAALRFDVDADAVIEDDDDDDYRPRVMPRRRQTKSGQPVGPRTDEPSIQGARFLLLACKRAPNTGHGTVHLLHGGNTKIAPPPCNFRTNHVRPSAINVLSHIRPYSVHNELHAIIADSFCLSSAGHPPRLLHAPLCCQSSPESRVFVEPNHGHCR
jgi:hypothetical protein